jgi:hypothetical protein
MATMLAYACQIQNGALRMSITSNGGNIGRIHWVNGDPSLSDRERTERYLVNKYGIVQHLLYGKPLTPRFGRVWWEEESDQLEITPTPARWNPPKWTPAELPGLACWYSPNDGVYADSKAGQKFLRDLSGNGGHMIVAGETIEAIFTNNP